MVIQQNTVPMKVTPHWNTTNKSFLDMHYFLKMKKINNNAFFLALYDTDLMNIDPRDPNLPRVFKMKVLRECQFNYWYFLREIIRVPDTGGTVGGGVPYKLDRGNLALNFGFTLNWNMFLELPRQFGKTTSALCWYLWVFNFGTTNSEIMFMNKKHDDSKMNLRRMKDMRKALPDYLQMDSMYGPDGKKMKPISNVETLSHVSNGNKITTKPGANSKAKANGLGRGCTMPMQWYDEYAFILYNKIIYMSATPAFSTASRNARKNGKPYGILITTTPGDLTTEEGMNANATRCAATVFNERFYDSSPQELEEIRRANTKSNFFYIRFTYLQLGAGDDYFQSMVKDLEKDWPTIRREVLLEWATMANNSPFTQQDLDLVETYTQKDPIAQIKLGPAYFLDVWQQTDLLRYPPIIGVDVSGGFSQDSSAITIIDSRTTKVLCTFNCNFISPIDLAKVIYHIVVKYMPNAIVNVERNGGFGSSVISYLKGTSVKRNLYFEIKDRVVEEKYNGMTMVKLKQMTKVYGLDQTHATRELLMEILRDRMNNHKQKFVAPIITDELKTLEIKKNGRIEHADGAHDDQIFSYLLALYVWYEGKNLMENFGLEVREIKTDNTTDETLDIDVHQGQKNIGRDIEEVTREDYNDSGSEIKKQLLYLSQARSIGYDEWLQQQQNENMKAIQDLLRTPQGREAYLKAYHQDPDDVKMVGGVVELPSSVFNLGIYDEERELTTAERLQKQFQGIQNYR